MKIASEIRENSTTIFKFRRIYLTNPKAMKKTILTLAVLWCISLHAQDIAKHSNGLIYSPETMGKLHKISDSLNLKYYSCDLNAKYIAVPQAFAHYIDFDGHVKSIEDAMDSGMPFDELAKKYAHVIKSEARNLLVTRRDYTDYDDKHMLKYEALTYSYWGGASITFSYTKERVNDNKVKGRWIHAKGSSSAFYFLTDLETPQLPKKYCDWVQYVDCMVDTVPYEPVQSDDSSWEPKPKTRAVDEFYKYINNFAKEPQIEDFKDKSGNHDYKAYQKDHDKWDKEHKAHVDNVLSKTPQFTSLLQDAVTSVLKTGGGDEDLEYYALKYLDKNVALYLAMSRRVVGSCSQDNRPRQHAAYIATLSADAANWKVFLRSHLNIMNDRFDRVSDGSYAWAQRKTYIKELEELDINVIPLLMGSCLRVDNVTKNHYFSSIGRTGRALGETKDPAAIENAMLEAIKDTTLDDYNRMLMFYLCFNYSYYIENKAHKEEVLKDLKAAAATLPEGLKKQAEGIIEKEGKDD
jgi:hypothetical protein